MPCGKTDHVEEFGQIIPCFEGYPIESSDFLDRVGFVGLLEERLRADRVDESKRHDVPVIGDVALTTLELELFKFFPVFQERSLGLDFFRTAILFFVHSVDLLIILI